jgi:hypothetical protein
MLDKELVKHAGEFRNALRTYRYERTENGIFFPDQKVKAVGQYVHSVNGEDERVDDNLVVDEGLVYFLSVGLKSGSQITAWYLSLYSGNYTPVAGLTAASYPADATEITSGSEGYSESVRQTWTGGTIASNMVDNYSSKAAFTIATASSVVVRGAAMGSVSTKGCTTGTLLSASKFAASRTVYDGDTFELGYRVILAGV